MNHYVYLLTNKIDFKHYIGVRSCTCTIEEDIYMSSAKTVSTSYKNNCYKTILRICASRDEALAYEIFMHNFFDVGINPYFFNKAKQTTKKFNTQGTILSDDAKRKISIGHTGLSSGMKGKTHSAETKLKMSKAGKGKLKTDEHKAAIGKANKGKQGWPGDTNPRARAIQCIETGVVFSTIKEAAASIARNSTTILSQLSGKSKTAGGFTWKYVNSNTKGST